MEPDQLLLRLAQAFVENAGDLRFADDAQLNLMAAARGTVREEIAKIGYSAIVSDYVFSDVFAPSGASRKVTLAAFTHTPPSYRNAALAVVHANRRRPMEVVLLVLVH